MKKYLYRILRAEEYKAIKAGLGISAKTPGYDLSMEAHVRRKRSKTPWISTSKDPVCLIDWLIHKSPGAAMIRIDPELAGISYDISTQDLCFKHGIRNRWARHWAVGRREVLFKDHIPAEACEIVWEPNATAKVFSRKAAPDWEEIYAKFFPQPVPKKKAVPYLLEKIRKQVRPHLSVYRTKRIMEIVNVLKALTANSAKGWNSTTW